MPSAIRLPAPPPHYDQRDQAEFRRQLATWLQGIQGLAGATGGSTGPVSFDDLTDKPTTLAGYGITDIAPKTRADVVIVTASLASNATEDGTVAAAGGQLIVLEADKPCRVRLYASSSARAADAARPRDEDYDAGTGVHCEFIFTGADVFACDPVPFLYNDSVAGGDIYYAITNDGLASEVVTVTLTVIPLEDA